MPAQLPLSLPPSGEGKCPHFMDCWAARFPSGSVKEAMVAIFVFGVSSFTPAFSARDERFAQARVGVEVDDASVGGGAIHLTRTGGPADAPLLGAQERHPDVARGVHGSGEGAGLRAYCAGCSREASRRRWMSFDGSWNSTPVPPTPMTAWGTRMRPPARRTLLSKTRDGVWEILEKDTLLPQAQKAAIYRSASGKVEQLSGSPRRRAVPVSARQTRGPHSGDSQATGVSSSRMVMPRLEISSMNAL